MRFNPPPNWPQPPEGWSPPPGWEPDPSWPAPPPGWQVWVEDDTFLITPNWSPSAPARTRSTARATQPWYLKTAAVVIMLLVFFPIGLVLLWLRQDWSMRRRGLITAIVGVFVLIVALTPSPKPNTTTALPPATVSTTSASPSASGSSQAAAPSPSPVTLPSTAAAVTSAPPKPSPAAPVHTSAPVHTAPAVVRTTSAPVHTSPQPVQTTAQKQSCYPLTNSGNCYKPGEYCRTGDHGATGIDAEGDAIKCEDNNGWRWERI